MLTLEEIYKSINSVFKVSLTNFDANGDEILPVEKIKEGFLNQHGLVAVTESYIQAFEILADKFVFSLLYVFPYLKNADIVVVRFGPKYKQWNAAFDAAA